MDPYINIHQEQHQNLDYGDTLEPGYRFCPTDSELIIYYLTPKINATLKQPKCRLHEVNIYDYTPQELADRYRSCDGSWYFLTPRERSHPNDNRPNRKTKDLGFWRTTQKDKPVYYKDDVMSGVEVGSKRCLAYFKNKSHKTPWLMYEYTTVNPNKPIGSKTLLITMRLTDWVLCKMYKKGANNNHQELNQLHDQETSSKRKKVALVEQESNRPNDPMIQNYETNHDDQLIMSSANPISPFTMQPIMPAAFPDSSMIEPAFKLPRDEAIGQSRCDNEIMPASTNIIRSYDPFSSSHLQTGSSSATFSDDINIQQLDAQIFSNQITCPSPSMEVDAAAGVGDEFMAHFDKKDDSTPIYNQDSTAAGDDDNIGGDELMALNNLKRELNSLIYDSTACGDDDNKGGDELMAQFEDTNDPTQVVSFDELLGNDSP